MMCDWRVLALCLVLADCGTARADELRTYTVRPGDTCRSIARQMFGDSQRIDLLHTHNDLGPPPHNLKAGQLLRLPLSEPDARLTLVRNQVETYTPERAQGRKNDPLIRGDRVRTLASSFAEITFADKSWVELSEHSLVVIFGSSSTRAEPKQGTNHRPVTTELQTGRLRSHLGALAGTKTAKPLALTTPSAQVDLGAGEAQVHVDEAKSTGLAVYKGRGAIKAQRKMVTVHEGYGTRAEMGKAPEAPRRLPPAPWFTSLPEPVHRTKTQTADLSATYGVVPGATAPTRWHVQVAKTPEEAQDADRDFSQILVDSFVGGEIDRLALRALPPGEYRMRVSALDDAGLEGPFSEPASVRVIHVPVVAGTASRAEGGVHLPPVQIPPPPIPTKEPQRLAFQVGAGGGLGLATTLVELGGHALLDLGMGIRLPHGSLSIWLRPGYEHYEFSKYGYLPCQLAQSDADCTTLWEGPYGGRTRIITGAIPITYHVLPPRSRIVPYFGLSANLLFVISETYAGAPDARTEVSSRLPSFGGSALVGGELLLGPGHLFLEASARFAEVGHRATRDSSLGWFHFSIGYRFHGWRRESALVR